MRHEIKVLTGMRFLAAFAVLISHSFSIFNDKFSLLGGIGVFYFFILSGFILSYNYQNKIKCGNITWYKFILLRLARIYPIYFMVMLIWGIYGCFHQAYATNSGGLWFFIKTLFLLQSFTLSGSGFFNPPSWSVSVELFFYVCFIPLIRFYKNNVYHLILLIAIIQLIWSVIYYNFIPENSQTWGYYSNPYYRVIDFIFGIMIYQLFNKNKIQLFNKMNNKYQENSLQYFCIVSLIELIVLCMPFLFYYKVESYYLQAPFIYHLVPMLMMGLILVTFLQSNGFIKKLLSTKICCLLGESSYNLYLIHWIFIFGIFSQRSIFETLMLDLFVVILSIIIFIYIEKPLHNNLRNVIKRKMINS